MSRLEGTLRAPEFPEALEWLNTGRPLHIKELRGKVVLLDFWTYCCINCMHVIPELKRLEKKYADELVVIGVHSAKFTTERQTENIRQAILRYEIEHPVANDNEMVLWKQYGVRAWPTLVLIDPAGKVVGYVSGEGVYDRLDRAIGELTRTFDARGQIDWHPLNLRPEREGAATGYLSFPGKVVADEASGQLFIADTNHNRLVVVALEGWRVTEVIGAGSPGMADGDFETATFNHPHGMAFDGSRLWVADTENHAIRRIDFTTRSVTTAAGTGQQAGSSGAGPGRRLNSPWDVVLQGGYLYIAMAGPHQLWRLDLKSGRVEPYAGSGREGRVDGPLATAALAQPSGITTDGKRLYFADSEVSSIRAADLDPAGRVETIVGGDLFEFGDRDGRGLEVRLQHPIGVVYYQGALYVADTYNNKIKRIRPDDRFCETFLGTGQAGLEDGERAAFDEPEGVSVAAGLLYIADTNNHAVRVADLATRRVETLRIKAPARRMPPVGREFEGRVVELPGQRVQPGETTLTLELKLPDGHKLSPGAPCSATFISSAKEVLSLAGGRERISRALALPLRVPVTARPGRARVTVDVAIYYCRAEEELCRFSEARLIIPVEVSREAPSRDLSLRYQPTLP